MRGGFQCAAANVSSVSRSGRLDEDRIRPQLFETEIYGATQRAGSVPRHGRKGHALPRMENEFPLVVQIDGQAAADDHEEFIGCRMIVPSVSFIENGKPQTSCR